MTKNKSKQKKPLTIDELSHATAEYYDAVLIHGPNSREAADIREKYAFDDEFRSGIGGTNFSVGEVKRRRQKPPSKEDGRG